MKYSFVLSTLIATISAHGLVTEIQGANGVNMPGLGVADGVVRDSGSATRNNAESDTTVFRGQNPLGRNKNGPISAEKAVSMFMWGTNTPPANAQAAGGAAGGSAPAAAGAAKGSTAGAKAAGAGAGAAAKQNEKRAPAGLLGGLGALGGGAGGKGAGGGLGALGGLLGGGGGKGAGGAAPATGTKTAKGTVEKGVAAAAGQGQTSGLPTCTDNGVVSMTFHQVNQDGAGPLKATVDATSGGKDASAFKPAKMVQDVPGIGIGGLSAASTMDFPIKVQMPAGMVCSGTVAGIDNVCIAGVQNAALAGGFGGHAAFQQSPTARKRAIEYNLRKRHIARGLLARADAE